MTTFSKSEQNLPCTTLNFASKKWKTSKPELLFANSPGSLIHQNLEQVAYGKNWAGFSREGKENGYWKKTVWIFGEIGEMYKAWTPFLKCIFCDKELLLLSHFSRVQLCVTPQTAAHQAPPSLGFSRQEHPNNISIWYSLSGKDYEDMGLGRLEFSCIKFNTYLTASHIHYFHSSIK